MIDLVRDLLGLGGRPEGGFKLAERGVRLSLPRPEVRPDGQC